MYSYCTTVSSSLTLLTAHTPLISRQKFMIMSFSTLLNHVKRMRLSVSCKMIHIRWFLRFGRNVIRRLQRFLLLGQRFIQHLIPNRWILYINHVIIVHSWLIFGRCYLFDDGYVPVVNFRWFSIAFETNRKFFVRFYDGIWSVVHVIMRIWG